VDDDSLSPEPTRAPVARFSPDLRLTALAAGCTLLAVGLALASDPAGRLLFLIAAVVLAAYVGADLVFRPRLTVDATHLRVRSPFGSTLLAWSDVEAVHADRRQRLGLNSVTLELDAGAHLVVLSRRALGADPEDVAALIRSFDPREPGPAAQDG
jgi:hypothetical protein